MQVHFDWVAGGWPPRVRDFDKILAFQYKDLDGDRYRKDFIDYLGRTPKGYGRAILEKVECLCSSMREEIEGGVGRRAYLIIVDIVY